jgi:hypothetical protein
LTYEIALGGEECYQEPAAAARFLASGILEDMDFGFHD